MTILLGLLACKSEGVEVPLPVFPVETGYGFPEGADTVHDIARETGGLLPETGDTAGVAASFSVRYGLFTWEYPYAPEQALGIITLHEEAYSCLELFGQSPSYYYPNQFGNKPYPDDLSWYVFAPDPDQFVRTYEDCGQTLDCFQGYYYIDDAFGPLDGTLEITALDAHYVTVEWTNSTSSGGPFTFYNCGNRSLWEH